MINKINKSGFTILETVIAITIFASLLTLSTVGFARLGTIYTKSIVTSKNLELTRNLMSDVAGQIQFGSTLPDISSINSSQNQGDRVIFCIGSYAYQVIFGVVQTNSNDPVIKRQLITNQNCPTTLDPLLSENISFDKLRVQKFTINKIPNASNLWSIKIKLSTGDDFLFNQNPSLITNPAGYEDWKCRGDVSGNEFCAITELETIVKRKINT